MPLFGSLYEMTVTLLIDSASTVHRLELLMQII